MYVYRLYINRPIYIIVIKHRGLSARRCPMPSSSSSSNSQIKIYIAPLQDPNSESPPTQAKSGTEQSS